MIAGLPQADKSLFHKPDLFTLFTREDLDLVKSYGADAVLVGESLMSQEDILSAVKKLIGKL